MKILLCILLTITIKTSTCQSISKLKEKLQAYFKHLPYNKDFYNWIDEFKTDPAYKIDSSLTKKERDSTHIVLKGIANYQPFMLGADHINFFITKFGLYNSFTKRADTLTNIYIYLFLDSALTNKTIVINEYKRLNKEFEKFFAANKDYVKREKGKIIEQTNNYKLDSFDKFPTLIINWHRDKQTQNYFIGISIVITFYNLTPI